MKSHPDGDIRESPLVRLEAFARDLKYLGDPEAANLGDECLANLCRIRTSLAEADKALEYAQYAVRVESARAGVALDEAMKWKRRCDAARLERDALASTLEAIASGLVRADMASVVAREALDKRKERRREK